jgi:hypothetical protein
MESGYYKKEKEFLATSLERSGLEFIFNCSNSRPETDQEIKIYCRRITIVVP